jgi:cAMP-binding proteins - catabolite gene activator and regulatory subunit of cAMP-dependent protein kinases
MNSSKIGTNKNITRRNEKTFKRGGLMFIEGETSTEMYILRSGKVRILKQEGDNTIELAVLGPGSVLGELSLLDHQPRGATGQVLEEVVATVIDENLFVQTLARTPSWLTNIIKLVVKRLRDTMKKTSDDIVHKSVAGTIRVLLLLFNNEGFKKDEMPCVKLARTKELVYATIGLGSLEAEDVLFHLILKDMIMIRKNEAGQEYIILKNIEVLQLYMNFLRAKQRGSTLIGDGISEKAGELIDMILNVGEKGGKKIQASLFSVGQAQIELEMEKAGKGRFLDLDAVDELIASKIIVRQDEATESKYGAHKRSNFMYNVETLKRVRLLNLYEPVFKEEVKF